LLGLADFTPALVLRHELSNSQEWIPWCSRPRRVRGISTLR
jgi:hypothetical protein